MRLHTPVLPIHCKGSCLLPPLIGIPFKAREREPSGSACLPLNNNSLSWDIVSVNYPSYRPSKGIASLQPLHYGKSTGYGHLIRPGGELPWISDHFWKPNSGWSGLCSAPAIPLFYEIWARIQNHPTFGLSSKRVALRRWIVTSLTLPTLKPLATLKHVQRCPWGAGSLSQVNFFKIMEFSYLLTRGHHPISFFSKQ